MRDGREERSRQRVQHCGKIFIESGGRVYGCLLNYSYNFFFVFVIPQNIKLERVKMKDLPGFPFCIQSLFGGKIGLDSDIYRVFPPSLSGLPSCSEILSSVCKSCTWLGSAQLAFYLSWRETWIPLLCMWKPLLGSHRVFRNFGWGGITLNSAKKKHWNSPVKRHV